MKADTLPVRMGALGPAFDRFWQNAYPSYKRSSLMKALLYQRMVELIETMPAPLREIIGQVPVPKELQNAIETKVQADASSAAVAVAPPRADGRKAPAAAGRKAPAGKASASARTPSAAAKSAGRTVIAKVRRAKRDRANPGAGKP